MKIPVISFALQDVFPTAIQTVSTSLLTQTLVMDQKWLEVTSSQNSSNLAWVLHRQGHILSALIWNLEI